MGNKRNKLKLRKNRFLHLRSLDRNRDQTENELTHGNPIPQESEFVPIMDIKNDPETVLPAGGSSDEIETTQFVLDDGMSNENLHDYNGTVGKSTEDVDSILDLLHWLDSCGTIMIKEEDAELIRNQICRFYSQFFKAPRSATSTHNLRRRKTRSTTSTTSRDIGNIFKRTRKVINNEKPITPKNVKNGSKSKNVDNLVMNSSEDFHGLNTDWTSLCPTIKEKTADVSITIEEFQNQVDDFDDSLSLPNLNDQPDATDTGHHDPTNVNVNPAPAPARKKRGVYQKIIEKCSANVCDQCGKTYTRRRSLAKHLEIHSNSKSHVCEICGRGFALKDYLTRHLLTHANLKNHVCEICGRGFNEKKILNHHLRRHKDGRKYLCDQCPKSYLEHVSLKAHQLKHIGDKKRVCQVCNKGFFTSHELKGHSLIHSDEKSFKCTFCPKEFRHRKTLTSHVRIHTGDKRYKCEPCGEAFVQIGSLIFHNRTRHGIVKEKEPLNC